MVVKRHAERQRQPGIVALGELTNFQQAEKFLSELRDHLEKENPLRSPLRNGFICSRLLTLVLGRLKLLGTRPRSPLRLRAPSAPTTARLPIPFGQRTFAAGNESVWFKTTPNSVPDLTTAS